jgi:hypothetical protein
MEFFIDVIFLAAIWLAQPLTEMSNRSIYWEVNAAVAKG